MKSAWSSSWAVRCSLLAIIAVSAFSLSGWNTVSAQKDKPVVSDEERAQNVSSLKKAFGGMQIDLFFEMGELETRKPGISGVKFVDVVNVTGKELLQFENAGDSWLIDPDTVFVYKLHKAK